VHQRAGLQSAACREAASLYAELLKRVREGKREIDVRVRVAMVRAVEEEVVGIRLATRDGDADRGRVVVRRNKTSGCTWRDGGAPSNEDQISCLPTIERERGDAALVDNVGKRGVVGLYHRCIGRDRHFLRNGANLQRYVDLDVVADLENDS